jgi:hypothetical protein
VLTSPQDIATNWPATTKITSFRVNQGGNSGFQIIFDKRDGPLNPQLAPLPGSWPDVPAFGPIPAQGGGLEYTLWGFVSINGQWYGSGVIQIWRDPSQTLWIGGDPSGMAANWWYDANRWGPLTTHQPQVGEQVGFMVSAGNVRNNPALPDPNQVLVQERSNIIVIPFPTNAGVVFDY